MTSMNTNASTSTDRKIVVPEGMLRAAYLRAIQDADGAIRYDDHPEVKKWKQSGLREVLEAALTWLLNNPQFLSDSQYKELRDEWYGRHAHRPDEFDRWYTSEIMRRMFLAPEPTPEPTPQSIVTHVIDPVAAAVRDKLKEWTRPQPDADLLIGRLIEEVRLATRTEP